MTPASLPGLIYGARCRAAPIRSVGSSSRTRYTPIHNLALLCDAPTGHESTRHRHADEIDRERIVDDASRAGWSRDPAIGTAVGVEPRDDMIEPTAQAFTRDRNLGSSGKPPLGIPNCCYAALIEQTGDSRSGVMPVGPRFLSDRPGDLDMPSSVNWRRRTFRSAMSSSRVR